MSQDKAVEAAIPEPEVVVQAERRRFTAKYKLRILEEADGCNEPGEIGALLRREGLYSSYLSRWRRHRDQGQLQALAPKKRGRKNAAQDQRVEDQALGVPRSSLYRARQPKKARQPRPTPERALSPWASGPRALSQEEKVQVRQVLNSERFQDSAPRQVYATLLDEGEGLCLSRGW